MAHSSIGRKSDFRSDKASSILACATILVFMCQYASDQRDVAVDHMPSGFESLNLSWHTIFISEID